jgi:hypothetical protein
MDQLVETNTISSNVEEVDFVACPNGRMKESNVETEESHDEEENMVFLTPCSKDATIESDEGKEGIELATPRS